MDGLMFLWMMWLCWIISTFLLEKQNDWRLRSSASALILIISFPFGIELFGLQVGVSAALIFLYSMYFIRGFSLSEKLYLFLSSSIIGLSYSSFTLLSFYDPIMLIMDKKIMVSVILIILSVLLYGDMKFLKKRQLAIIIGMLTGECLTGNIFIQNKLPYQIGGSSFLDVLSIIVASGFALHLFQYLANSQSSYIKSALKKGEVKNI
ncbi:YphA family membrane protein [Bacillus salacetis]|uniref:YphA family membrane protein n=1 Tax=Bacillus salacetis TaxID=2315464 RepID=UPI003B9E8339